MKRNEFNSSIVRLCAAVLIFSLLTTRIMASEYSTIIAFGSSLTDSGNVYDKSPEVLGFHFPVSPPNYMGRFSNGPSWLDNFADLLDLERPIASELGGNNYAWAGATTGATINLFEQSGRPGIVDMDDQVAEYLREKTVAGDELFVIPGWASLNDFDIRQPEPATPANAAKYVGQIMNDLASAGAENFFIPLGMVIRTRNNQLTETVASYNSHLLDEINSVQQAFPNVTVTTFNAQPTVDGFYSDPASFGFRVLNQNACRDCAIDNPNPIQIADNPNEYLYWEAGHFTAPANEVLGKAAFERLTSPNLIQEDFDFLPSSGLPLGTTFVDTNIGREWGPGMISSENGEIRFQTTGEVPPQDPVDRRDTGVMVLTWDDSNSDSAFTDGYLRTTIRSDTPSNANIVMRGDLEAFDGYVFLGLGASGQFGVHCFCDQVGPIGGISSPVFEVGVDYHLEAGTVGNRITMKVWRVGDEEPALPQLVVFDDQRTEGAIALAPAASPASITQPTRVDVSYDNVSFLPSSLGDINQDSLVDVRDIHQLTDAVATANQHPYFDLNQDGSVNDSDLTTWVRGAEFAYTYFGDANLDGEFNTSDLVHVFAAAKYESGELANWAEGDWNGDGRFGTADLITAFGDGGFEQGPRQVTAVPEPASRLFGFSGFCILLIFCRARTRRRLAA